MREKQIVENMLKNDAFSLWLGVEVLSVGPGKTNLRMRVRKEMLNGFGVCHGGVTFALADSALAFACNTRGKVTVSIENSISYPAPVKEGDVLLAEAEEQSAGERVSFYNVRVLKEGDGTVVGLFRGTVYKTSKEHA